MKKNVLLTAIIMAFAMCVNAQNLVTNGDFETGDLTGWTVASGEIDMAAPIAGTASYMRGWGKGDLIEQTISTTAGKEYTLSYEGWVAWNWIYINAKIIDAADGITEIAATAIKKNEESPISVNFTAPAGGSVILKYTKTADSPGKIYIDNISIVEANPTDFDDVKQNMVKVSPNPSTGAFKIASENPIASYKVFNSVGQLIKEASSLALNEVNVDVTSGNKGLYVVQVTDNAGNTNTSKVIIK